MILKYMSRRDWLLALICASFVSLQVFIDLKIPEYISMITDTISSSGDFKTIYEAGRQMVLYATCSPIVSLIACNLAAHTTSSLCFSLRKRLFDKVGSFSPEDVGCYSTESLITRCSSDVNQVYNYIAAALQVMVRAVVITIWCLLKTPSSNIAWTVVTLIGFTIFAVSIAFVNSSARPFFRKIPTLNDEIGHSALDHLTGVRTIRTHNAEPLQHRKFGDTTNDILDNSIGINRRSSLIIPISSAASNLITLSIFWTAIILISMNTGNPGNLDLFSDMIIYTSYVMLVVGNYTFVALMIQSIVRELESSKRISAVLEHENAIPEGDFDGEAPEPGTVKFRNVSFTFSGTDIEILHDVSFKAEKGKVLAIVGATSGGKTVIANLILRMYLPTEGSVLVEGVETGKYKVDDLHSRIGYVPQVNKIFPGTIESNVNFGSTRGSRTREDGLRALDIAQASEFVNALPDREKSEIDPNGHNFSGGQKQRISITRAICKDANILLLDDPFSALDFETDRKLRKSLAENCPDTARILITQRVGTARNADEIVILNNGRIVGEETMIS